MFRMTTSVACKTPYVTPPPGQYASEPVNVIVSQKGCDQAQVELNLMEITEVEYTHLQHLIQSHMDAQAGEEIRLNPPSSTEHESENSCKIVCPPTYVSPACQPDVSSSSSLPTDVQSVSVHSNKGLEDSKEVLLYSDVSSISSFGDSTPCGEISSSVLAKMRCFVEAAKERNVNRRVVPRDSRPNPPARVCLEKRFNCDSCDLTKKQESQAAVLNAFLSMVQNSTDLPGIGMHSQPEKWPKAEKTAAIDCTHSYTRNQALGDFSQILEDSQHPERTASKNLSVNQTVDFIPRPSCIIYTDSTNEEQIINTENKVTQKAAKQTRTRGARTLQARDPNVMQGSGKWKEVCSMASRKPGRRTRSPLELNQRKQRHNLREKDRRRRIRLCCDELNMLVPFCYPETDKATTLQWTTAYLKYIREVYGDSLKQNFQNTFCGKTGVRMKPSCANDALDSEKSATKE